MKVLIPTRPDDMHAICVKFALEKRGHEGVLWYTADYPTLQKHTFEVGDDKEIHWYSEGLNEGSNDTYAVVWHRRPAKPILADTLHPDDVENARKENMVLYQSFWYTVAPNAVWINPMDSKHVNSKLLQLKIAKTCGMSTPHTLVSNDADKIKDFMSQYKETIYKPLYPVAWLSEKEARLTYTAAITQENLPHDHVMQMTSGIFQNKIEKAYELRITYFDEDYIAVKIHSQILEQAKMDWRKVSANKLVLEQVHLPPSVHKQCRMFMEKFNLKFGCFDFIVTPENEYYFLEINEQGQFLWIEEVNPDIKMLNTFVDFLIKMGNDSHYQDWHDSMSLSFIHKSAITYQQQAMQDHKVPPSF